jgi:hypothetical protein
LVAALGLAAPLAVATAPSANGSPPQNTPPGLQPTQINVTNDLTHRYGEPEVAVNQKNPNNLVYFVMSERYTYQCQADHDPTCQLVPVPGLGGFPAPQGFFGVPGWTTDQLNVSFDRGKTWKNVPFPQFPPDHPDLVSLTDPMVVAAPDGTFYIGWNDQHLDPNLIVRNGGVAVSKSTDGGLTWSTPVLTGVPVDRPYMTLDPITGTIYMAAGGAANPPFGRLGPASTGDPAPPPPGIIGDRWLVSSQDGTQWTSPQRFGGGGTPGFPGAGDVDTTAAAYGILAAAFTSTNPGACALFVSGPAPCTVFQTTTDAGATWTRHSPPVPSNSQQPLVAADPAASGHFTLAVLNGTAGQFLVYQTRDAGATWSGPMTVTEDATKTHFKASLTYSPKGVLGLQWRTCPVGALPFASPCDQPGAVLTFPYNVWATISDNDGSTFTSPLQVSTGTSPAPDPTQLAGDDFSFLNLGQQDAFVAWGDWRPGELQGFFSDIKLQAFTHK